MADCLFTKAWAWITQQTNVFTALFLPRLCSSFMISFICLVYLLLYEYFLHLNYDISENIAERLFDTHTAGFVFRYSDCVETCIQLFDELFTMC